MTSRAEVAAKLEAWSAPGGPLDAGGPNSSAHLFRADANRRAALMEIKEQYLDRQHDIVHEGACAVVTAGPPAAGKSTAVRALGPGYRVVDPDAIKDLLVERALLEGTYDPLLGFALPDGRLLHPRELSGLVHVESTVIANDVIDLCLIRQENLVVEGTLRWYPHAESLLTLFEEHRYGHLSILSFNVPENVAQERALERWWGQRETFADGLGGRFVPSSVISDLYTKTVDTSDCVGNARELFMVAKGRIPDIYLRQEDMHAGVDEQRHRA